LLWRGAKIGVCNFEHRQPHALGPYRLYLQTVGAQITHAVQQRRERDGERVTESLDLMKVLSAFYNTVNHTIWNSFQEIESGLKDLADLPELRGSDALTADLTTLRAKARQGVEDAAALLAGSAGSLEETEVVDVAELLDQTVRRAAQEQSGRRTPPHLQESPSHCNVRARPRMLRWCLWTVIENSYKHGGPDTRIWIHSTIREADAIVSIVVEDDGPGLTEEECLGLYSPDARREREGDHGLGLIAASQYLVTMRGRISSTRSERGGLRTEIELPWRRPLTGASNGAGI
jgi:K+-sensing histidine kinase KdpD